MPPEGAAAEEATSSAALQDSLPGAEAGAQVEPLEPHSGLTAETDSTELRGGPMEAAEAAPGSSGPACVGREAGDEWIEARQRRPRTPARPSQATAPLPPRCSTHSHEPAFLEGFWSSLYGFLLLEVLWLCNRLCIS